jgi:hypothetical protein
MRVLDDSYEKKAAHRHSHDEEFDEINSVLYGQHVCIPCLPYLKDLPRLWQFLAAITKHSDRRWADTKL